MFPGSGASARILLADDRVADSRSWPTLNEVVLPRNLQTSLLATQVVAFATLVRSVAYDRWITVLASLLLIAGASAALRGRTWGVVLSFACAAAFPVAWAIGIAPAWFVGVGVIGALPFALSSDAMAKMDRQATSLLAFIAATSGAVIAVAWKLLAWDAFRTFPALWPSQYPQHGLAVTALLVAGAVAVVAHLRRRRSDQVRIESADRVRVREPLHQPFAAAAHAEAEVYDDERAPLRRRH